MGGRSTWGVLYAVLLIGMMRMGAGYAAHEGMLRWGDTAHGGMLYGGNTHGR